MRPTARPDAAVGGAIGADARGPSLRLRLARAIVRLGFPPAEESTLQRRYVGRAYPRPAPATRSLRARCEIREARVLGHPVYTVVPRARASAWHLVYTHGGGFVNPLRSGHWHTVRALVEATGATVTVPVYPLAPEHTHEATFRLLEQLHRDLLARVAPERIVHCGDSAGGNLALTQALHFRARGLPLPGHLVLFSPWLDLTMADPAAEALEPRDLMLRVGALRRLGRWWAGAADPRTPVLSPVYADADALRALPPIQLYVGTDDVLLPDCRTLRDRVAAAGGRLVYDETPHGFHVFMAATFAPEAKRVLRRVAECLTPSG